MTQISLIRRELRQRGVSKTISLAAIAAGAMKQYDRNSSELRSALRQFDCFNTISIMNNSTELIQVNLDFTDYKAIYVPAGTILGKDNITFQEFEVHNLDSANTTAVKEVFITFGYEPALLKESIKSSRNRG